MNIRSVLNITIGTIVLFGAARLTAEPITVRLQATSSQPDLSRYRTNKVDERVASVPDDLNRKAKADPKNHLKSLVGHLVAGVDDPFHRAKIIHDWIAHHISYDVDTYFDRGARAPSTWHSTLARGNSVCEGYASLFVEMSDLAGLRSEKIGGLGRGLAFSSGRSSPNGAGHAWNAVEIKGRWYLVDTTWDAGHVDGRKFVKEFEHTYLFMEPGQFVFTHLPTDSKWQLLDPVVSRKEHAELPALRGHFFNTGLRLKSPLARQNRVGLSTYFDLTVRPDVKLISHLEDASGERVPRRTMVQRSEKTGRILVTFPNAGKWKVVLYSKKKSTEGTLPRAATFDFTSTKGTSYAFAKTYFAAHDAIDGALLKPIYTPLKASDEQEFKIRVWGSKEIFLIAGKSRWQQFQPVEGEPDTYQLKTAVKLDPPLRIVAKMVEGKKTNYWRLVDFLAE